ncbi:MAG: LPS export ABC transporter periplasmic protein LptC [Omnitrophica bacterium]|nr:LPS export ABC transporter periplasmic protein LptC [Candidatus Omnitrophota bacterium]
MGCAGEEQGPRGLALPEKASGSKEELEESPDEMLSSFSLSGYTKGGKKQWDLAGKSADIMTEEIKLTDITSKVYGKSTDMTIVADEGSLNRVDNNVHLEKNVKATTDDGATLTTDSLDWDAQNGVLTSEVPVEIVRGMIRARGIGLIAQPALNMVQLKKDVTVQLSLDEPADSAQRQGHIVITSDGPLKVEYENNLAIFHDNVKVKDNRGEIFAERIDIYFSTQAQGDEQLAGMGGMGIEKVIATGDVEIHRGANITYSQKAVYDTDTGKLTLTGQPKLVIYSTEDFSQLMGN